MRGQEVLALTMDDIDLEKNIITIRSAVSQRFENNDVSDFMSCHQIAHIS